MDGGSLKKQKRGQQDLFKEEKLEKIKELKQKLKDTPTPDIQWRGTK